MDDFRSWYTAPPGAEINAQNVFKEALDAFSAESSGDQSKREWIVNSNHNDLQSVFQTVIDARRQYEKDKGDSKVRRALIRVSETIHHYEGIIDVLVSSHPEYAALGWGAIKFLFVAVTTHEKLIYKLSTGLSDIAGVLPLAELVRELYPIPHIKRVIVAIYAQILEFLLRALKWYQESRIKRALHSITRPAELYWNDIQNTIVALSKYMYQLAAFSSYAELRDMHMAALESSHENKQRMDQLSNKIEELRALIINRQCIGTPAKIQTRQRLSLDQLHQVLGALTSTPLPDPVEILKSSLVSSDRYLQRASHRRPAFWLNKKIQDWNSSRLSSLVMVKGPSQVRLHMQNFCVRSIAMLREAEVPVIWVLKGTGRNEATSIDDVSTVDLLRYLIPQAITLNKKIHTDEDLSALLAAYRAARTEDDWVNVLASSLEGIPQLYIFVDVEVLSQHQDGLSTFWPSRLLKMFDDFSARNINTVIRIILVGCSTPLVNEGEDYQKSLVTVVKEVWNWGYWLVESKFVLAKDSYHGKSDDAIDSGAFQLRYTLYT
ncbi:uncharacterized protein F4812DRAFT_465756 [Daldinia caldariorum]|uniref:uncharacterized protein n=1 Tax=Daldinia caldariorum TaxID=326644 RepID=UPI0020072485|nr:uncharacterized protein F4812DRAFT_465756 [Daldinia caldariorum]KAI1466491.1 hypothetical protein F4812DRAFT_465756 [Daldinia caldariorum]